VLKVLSFSLQASLTDIVLTENDPGPARLILYSNLPITCKNKRFNPFSVPPMYEYSSCGIVFSIRSSEDIAVRQRLPYDLQVDKEVTSCKYELNEGDWKPDEGYAYDGNRSLDVVAKVIFSFALLWSLRYSGMPVIFKPRWKHRLLHRTWGWPKETRWLLPVVKNSSISKFLMEVNLQLTYLSYVCSCFRKICFAACTQHSIVVRPFAVRAITTDIICQTIVQHCRTSDLELTATCCVKLRRSVSLYFQIKT